MLQPRLDPLFNKPVPLLFAHRGGAREVPESTRKAFDHAKRVGSDVLELDIHRTADGEIVVWHGPSLHNVIIQGLPKPRPRNLKVTGLDWGTLQDAWVADPHEDPKHKYTESELAAVPREDDRRLLRLEDFLQEYAVEPLNIEIKGSIKKHHLESLLDCVGRHRNERVVVFACQRKSIIDRIRDIEQKNPYPTSLSIRGNLRFLLGLVRGDLAGRAVQTSYALAFKSLVRKIRRRQGAFHIFLSEFTWFFPAIDLYENTPDQNTIKEYLDRGVDGIMTDRPEHVRGLIDHWIAENR